MLSWVLVRFRTVEMILIIVYISQHFGQNSEDHWGIDSYNPTIRTEVLGPFVY